MTRINMHLKFLICESKDILNSENVKVPFVGKVFMDEKETIICSI